MAEVWEYGMQEVDKLISLGMAWKDFKSTNVSSVTAVVSTDTVLLFSL